MEFPHLGDTGFPHLQNSNVYQFKNEFDYTRWSENTKITLCNVLWDESYSDVVKFDTNAERDEWFDGMTDTYLTVLNTSARVVPDSSVKLPIPYDVMARFNYMFVDIPIATSDTNMIDYESDDGVRRWYFFVNEILYLAPNTTQVMIAPDVWTIFQNDITIRYMLLERGHAPMALSDVETYLSNPMENSTLLLAPDVSFGKPVISRDVDTIAYGSGTKYVCLASTCPPDMLSSLGTVTASQAYDPSGTITYSDTGQRYGTQLHVTGFGFGNGRDYSNAVTVATPATSNGNRIGNNLSIYAIPASDCYGSGTFLSDAIESCPQFLDTVQACFVVAAELITLGSKVTIAGHDAWSCIGAASTLGSISLSKSDFSYPTEYAEFAKLYTSPYAKMVVTDNMGTSFDILIEETTTVTAKLVCSVAFPYVNERVLLEGIRGSGSKAVTWKDLSGASISASIPESDWFDFCIDHEIPTFALYMDGETAYMLQSFNRNVAQGMKDALVAYHNHMRSSNTAKENACDSADTAKAIAYRDADAEYDNAIESADKALMNANDSADTAKENADDSADTYKTNADASADTAKVNAYNSADTNRQNAYNIADTYKTNTDSSADTAKQNAYNSAATAKTNADNNADTAKTNADNDATLGYSIVDNQCTLATLNLAVDNTATALREEKGIDASTAIKDLHNAMDSYTTAGANDLSWATTLINNDALATTTLNTAKSGIATGAISGAQSGAQSGSVPMVIGGAVMGGIGGAIAGFFNTQNANVQIGSDSNVTNITRQVNNLVLQYRQQNNTDVQDWQNVTRRKVYQIRQDANVDELTNANATARANALDTKNNAMTNAANSKATANTNAANEKATSETNADNSNNVAKSNATRNQGTTKTNADNTRATARTNADNTNATTKANATRTQATSKGNATRSRATARLNAQRLNDVAHNNATLTRNTSKLDADDTNATTKANAGYTRDVEEMNAKETLENAKTRGMAPILDARNALPVQRGMTSGNPAPDYYMTRGLQIKVKTQSDSAIRMAGDIFARFGYALNQMWNVEETGLKLMQHFTYWKSAEIWVDDTAASNARVQQTIANMFQRGVTVWNDPDEIGKVSIYDNYGSPL